MSNEVKATAAPLYDLAKLVTEIDSWAKRHRIKRLAANDVGIALERVCDRYEAERQRDKARIAELERMLEFWKKAALLARDEFVMRGDELAAVRAELDQSYSDHRKLHDLITATDGAWELIERQHLSSTELMARSGDAATEQQEPVDNEMDN
jgi:hypothetical protein